jgi:hypothetical protein
MIELLTPITRDNRWLTYGVRSFIGARDGTDVLRLSSRDSTGRNLERR